MYIPAHNVMNNLAEIHALMRACNFAALITPGEEGLHITHLPFFLDPQEGKMGTLYGHFAQRNPHWIALNDDVESSVVFSGPHAYVSPLWYTEPPKRVPTWNYLAVHAHGIAKPLAAGLESEVSMERLVAEHEGHEGWNLDYLASNAKQALLQSVVPFKLEIIRLEGKAKLDQNKPANDRIKVAEALESRGHADLAKRMRMIESEG